MANPLLGILVTSENKISNEEQIQTKKIVLLCPEDKKREFLKI